MSCSAARVLGVGSELLDPDLQLPAGDPASETLLCDDEVAWRAAAEKSNRTYLGALRRVHPKKDFGQ